MVNCCVVGCHNNPEKKKKNVQFYSFPNRDYQSDQKNKWVKAVNRINPDGSPWIPTKRTRICSEHFVGGKKSNVEGHPAFVPSIFPKIYRKRPSTNALDRYDRKTKRASLTTIQDTAEAEIDNSDFPGTCFIQNSTEKISKSVQCSLPSNESSLFEFTVDRIDRSNVQTQCILEGKLKSSRNIKMIDKACGPMVKSDGLGPDVLSDEKKLKELTSVSKEHFDIFLSLMDTISFNSLSKQQSLLLFLMKMKTNMAFSVLGIMFKIHRTTSTRIFRTILHVLFHRTKSFIFWPSKFSVQNSAPQVFKTFFPNCRAIIDCSEVPIEIPRTVSNRIKFYSSYKGQHTIKFLIGSAPNGFISFVSKCYPGKTSDTYITNNCGFLDLLESGDEVLADKGFPGIKCTSDKVIVMPPILHDGRFSEEEIMRTHTIASARVHVERCIQRIKIFKILKFIPAKILPEVDEILHMACVLANFLPPLFKDNI